MSPRIEIWTSDQNQEERHYFMPGCANEYIWGYNPKLISSAAAAKIRDIIRVEVEPK